MLTEGHFPLPPRPRPLYPNDRYRPPRPHIYTQFYHVPATIPPSLRSCPVSGHRIVPIQTGRHRPPNTPYGRPSNDRIEGQNGRGRTIPGAKAPLITRLQPSRTPINPNSRRDPIGPPQVNNRIPPERVEAQKAAHSKLNEKLRSEDMKMWLRSRLLQEGVMNMSVRISRSRDLCLMAK